MKWFFLSLGCATLTATAATISKLLLKKRDIFFVGWVRFIISIPVLIGIAFIYRAGFQPTYDFWKTIAMILPFELIAFLLYLRALELSPLSITFPFLGLTPVFTILTSSIILKERLGLLGIVGVSMVSLGAYLLNANTIKHGLLEPIKNIYRERGSMLMVVVAFLYSITSSLGKRGVLLSNPIIFPAINYSIFFLALSSLMVMRKKYSKIITLDRKDILLSLLLGLSFTLALILHFKAISLVYVSYMISVKRLSLILSVLFGAMIFKEKNIGYRMLGSFIMVCGIFILVWISK